MKRLIKFYFSNISNLLMMSFFGLYFLSAFFLGIGTTMTEDFDLGVHFSVLGGVWGILAFVSTSAIGDEQTLLLTGVKRNEYVNFRYLHSLVFFLLITFGLVLRSVNMLPTVYLFILILLFAWLVKENIFLPFKISASTKSIAKILMIYIGSGLSFFAIYIVCIQSFFFNLPALALQITATVLTVVYFATAPLSIRYAKKLYAKKDVT